MYPLMKHAFFQPVRLKQNYKLNTELIDVKGVLDHFTLILSI